MRVHPWILHRRQSGAEDLCSHRFLPSDHCLDHSNLYTRSLGLLWCSCSGWNGSWHFTNCCTIAHYRIISSTPATDLHRSIQRSLVHRVNYLGHYWFCWTHDCRELVMETPLLDAGVLSSPSIDRTLLCLREPQMAGLSGQERGWNGYTGEISRQRGCKRRTCSGRILPDLQEHQCGGRQELPPLEQFLRDPEQHASPIHLRDPGVHARMVWKWYERKKASFSCNPIF